MKADSLSPNYWVKLNGFESQFGTQTPLSGRKKISFSGVLKSALTVLILFVCFNASAQGTAANTQSVVPIVSISGDAVGQVNGGHLFITAEAFAGKQAIITFSIDRNVSGASIVSQGTFVYDTNSGKGTQVVEINPGVVKGNFRIKADVSNKSGTAQASMTAAVNN